MTAATIHCQRVEDDPMVILVALLFCGNLIDCAFSSTCGNDGLRWRLLSARIVIPTRFHPIEVSTMGPTRNYDKGQKGEQMQIPKSCGINSLLKVPQC